MTVLDIWMSEFYFEMPETNENVLKKNIRVELSHHHFQTCETGSLINVDMLQSFFVAEKKHYYWSDIPFQEITVTTMFSPSTS